MAAHTEKLIRLMGQIQNCYLEINISTIKTNILPPFSEILKTVLSLQYLLPKNIYQSLNQIIDILICLASQPLIEDSNESNIIMQIRSLQKHNTRLLQTFLLLLNNNSQSTKINPHFFEYENKNIKDYAQNLLCIDNYACQKIQVWQLHFDMKQSTIDLFSLIP